MRATHVIRQIKTTCAHTHTLAHTHKYTHSHARTHMSAHMRLHTHAHEYKPRATMCGWVWLHLDEFREEVQRVRSAVTCTLVFFFGFTALAFNLRIPRRTLLTPRLQYLKLTSDLPLLRFLLGFPTDSNTRNVQAVTHAGGGT